MTGEPLELCAVVHLWVSGGVVWDSEGRLEVDGSWVKARPLLRASASRVPEAAPR